jgi:hypothetical protein
LRVKRAAALIDGFHATADRAKALFALDVRGLRLSLFDRRPIPASRRLAA